MRVFVTYLAENSNNHYKLSLLLWAMRKSVHNKIEQRIAKASKGSLVFNSHFKGIGSTTAIRMTLSRLEREKVLIRISQGIYLVPEYDSLVGLKFPSLEDIANAIAKRDHARIRPAGTYALHKLGLSTQIPMNLVYETDGSPRTVKVGKNKIKFKATTPRKLSLKGKLSSLVIQALEELGQKNVTPEIWKKIEYFTRKEDQKLLLKDLMFAPAWISDQLLKTLR